MKQNYGYGVTLVSTSNIPRPPSENKFHSVKTTSTVHVRPHCTQKNTGVTVSGFPSVNKARFNTSASLTAFSMPVISLSHSGFVGVSIFSIENPQYTPKQKKKANTISWQGFFLWYDKHAMKRLSVGQQKTLADFFTNTAVGWFSAGIIAPLFVGKRMEEFFTLGAWGILLASLFLMSAVVIMKGVKTWRFKMFLPLFQLAPSWVW